LTALPSGSWVNGVGRSFSHFQVPGEGRFPDMDSLFSQGWRLRELERRIDELEKRIRQLEKK
jgi:hypothetical protein